MLTIVRVPRLPRWPLWAVAVTGAWLGLVGFARAVAPHAILCTFRRITGVPCPGCGLTRGVTALAQGEIAGAFAFNPLLIAALLLFLPLAALRLLVGRAPRLRIHRAALLFATLLVLANWAYVIHTDRSPVPLARPPEPARVPER